MTLLQNEVESIHRAKKATNAIRDDAAYAEVESAIEDLIKVIGRLQSRSIESNKRINRMRELGNWMRKYSCNDWWNEEWDKLNGENQ
jgi:tRNA C32,U32 (ribose-2'-O)-methylase TrmJ